MLVKVPERIACAEKVVSEHQPWLHRPSKEQHALMGGWCELHPSYQRAGTGERGTAEAK